MSGRAKACLTVFEVQENVAVKKRKGTTDTSMGFLTIK
jgi:hypothetical protein